jgi:hypothetical protein
MRNRQRLNQRQPGAALANPRGPAQQQTLYRSFLGQDEHSRHSTFVNHGYIHLQRRIQESMRDVRNSRQNLSLIMNMNHQDGHGQQQQNLGFGFGHIGNTGGGELSMMLFNSPCKLHYSVNQSDWSEGVDLDLMNLKKAPLNLVVSMPPEMHRETELIMSRAAYFTQWETIPRSSFLIKKSQE